MNLRTAVNELHGPPRISINSLILEGVGMFAVAYVLVNVAA